MNRTHRVLRVAAAVVAGALGIAFAGCSSSSNSSAGGSGTAEFAGQTLTVAAYSGSWGQSFQKAFVAPFEAATGATVKLVPGSPAEWLSTLRSTSGGTPAYDLVAFTPNVVPTAVSAGVVSPLDTSRISSFSDLNAKLVAQGNVNGTQYGLPLTVGSVGLAYRTDKVTTAPKDWSDIFDPNLCGHVAVSPLTFDVGLEFLAGLINESGGSISNSSDVDAAFTKLESLKKCASTYPSDGSSVETALQNGDAWIAAYYDGRAFVQKNNGVPVGFTYPSSGSVGALTSFFVAKGTKKENLAYKFMNYLASSDYQPTFSTGTWYAASNDKNVYPDNFNAQIKSGPNAYDSFVWIDYQKLTPQLADLQARWQKIFS